MMPFVRGFNDGTEFSGGTEIQAALPGSVQAQDVRKALTPLNLAELRIQSISSDKGNEYLIRVPSTNESGADIAQVIGKGLRDAFGKDKVDIRRADMVGAAVSKDIKMKGFLSLFYAWIGIVIYVWFRFEFSFSIGALVAIIHDVVVVLGIFALLGKEINLTIVAAVLTIIGYSVNDTVVVFDRIRENIKKKTGSFDLFTVINESTSQTLSRTILTSFTVFLVVVVLFFLGGSVIHDFAFAMIIGVVLGTYSSIFIASPIMAMLHKETK
jgi:preprotein translocase subunit SecF